MLLRRSGGYVLLDYYLYKTVIKLQEDVVVGGGRERGMLNSQRDRLLVGKMTPKVPQLRPVRRKSGR